MQAAYCALGQYEAACKDADEAIALDPLWAKTYSRKGKALYARNSFKKAADAYARGLELCLKGAITEAQQRDTELEYGLQTPSLYHCSLLMNTTSFVSTEH